MAALEKEIGAKQAYWVCQREREEELLKELDFLWLDVLDAAKEGKMKKVPLFCFASDMKMHTAGFILD